MNKTDQSRWTDPRQVSFRLVPDPSMSDAEYFHQRQTKSGPHVGKVTVAVSMLELIGGLARIKGRTEVQEAAAARLRLLHERAQIGGARAIDYAAVKVDTSGHRYGLVADIGQDARQDYQQAVRHLGMIRSSLVERIVVHDQPISRVAGKGARARHRTTVDLLAALDELGVYFQLAPRAVA